MLAPTARPWPNRRRGVAAWAAAVLAGLTGCVEVPEEPACVALPAECNPLYAPTFENVHARTLAPTCASDAGVCHGNEGARGGMALEDRDAAYEELLGLDGETPRIKPGDAECSRVMVRLQSRGDPWAMPPGHRLSAEERCAVQRWIEEGALP